MAIKKDLMRDKLFDPKAYNTVYINQEDENKVRTEQMEILIELLCDERYKDGREQVFKFLKKEPKAVELLIRAIREATGDKKRLVAVCWEGNIDCHEYASFFTDIVIKDEFEIALEAFTVLEQITGEVPAEQIKSLTERVKAAYSQNDPKAALYMDLVELFARWQA